VVLRSIEYFRGALPNSWRGMMRELIAEQRAERGKPVLCSADAAPCSIGSRGLMDIDARSVAFREFDG